jgi:hypothetical protein
MSEFPKRTSETGSRTGSPFFESLPHIRPHLHGEPSRTHDILDHDDFGLNRSKIMKLVDSESLERDAGGKPVFIFPHQALARGLDHYVAEPARAANSDSPNTKIMRPENAEPSATLNALGWLNILKAVFQINTIFSCIL